MSGQVIVNEISLELYDELFKSPAYRTGLISYNPSSVGIQMKPEGNRSVPSHATNIVISWGDKAGLRFVIEFLQKVEHQHQ